MTHLIERSMKDKLLGRNKLVHNDALTEFIETFIGRSGVATDIRVDREAA